MSVIGSSTAINLDCEKSKSSDDKKRLLLNGREKAGARLRNAASRDIIKSGSRCRRRMKKYAPRRKVAASSLRVGGNARVSGFYVISQAEGALFDTAEKKLSF